MSALTRIAREREHGLPVILLGHSMGSIAAQQYIIEHSLDIAGVALSGSVATDLLAMNSPPDGDLTAFNKPSNRRGPLSTGCRAIPPRLTPTLPTRCAVFNSSRRR